MHRMNISAVDLNLLVVFDALFRERSVTRAAARIGLSQSATSHALTRLRRLFDDELFVRTPQAMVPTERSEAIHGPVSQALAALQDTLSSAKGFDPAVSQRTFRIAVDDYVCHTVLPNLVTTVSKRMPGAWFDFAPIGQETVLDRLANRELDFAFQPRSLSRPGYFQKKIWTESFACLVDQKHPIASQQTITLERYLAYDHLLIAPRGQKGGIVDTLLDEKGLERRVRIILPFFGAAPAALEGTKLILTLPARLASIFEKKYRLRMLKPQLRIPTFDLFLLWHERSRRDLGHDWLKRQILEKTSIS